MIHETAVIDPGAELGAGVTVGPYTVIEGDVTIGDGCRIGPHAALLRYTTLGADCEVHAGAVLGDTPQDVAFEETPSYVRIGDRCRIREGVTINRGTKPGTATVVGNDCFLMGNAHCAHNVVLGDRVILANGVLLAGYVSVGEHTFIGGNAGVHQFVSIGRLVMVGGAAGISRNVPSFCMVRPCALNTIAGLNVVGIRRSDLGEDERRQVKQAFRIVYRSGKTVPEALQALRETGEGGIIQEYIEFIENSERGICTRTEE